MLWNDFFYFSKGERSALIVLLCLIVIAGVLLSLNDKSNSTAESASDHTVANSQIPDSSGVRSAVLSASKSSSSGKAADRAGETSPVVESKKETVSERVTRITSYSRPRQSYPRVEKFKKGTVVELNAADTTMLKKVPGIGSAYARRIVNYRRLLGGYYSVTQLSEVYGMDEDRYNALVPWFTADPSLISKLPVNELSQDSLRRHPYINYSQAKVITQLRRRKGKLTGWENLQLLDEFTDLDRMRLPHYLSFE
jgi:DNA uptake protein ComE-like DNA-binding protein